MSIDTNLILPFTGVIIGMGYGLSKETNLNVTPGVDATFQMLLTLCASGVGAGLGVMLNKAFDNLESSTVLSCGLFAAKYGLAGAVGFKVVSFLSNNDMLKMLGAVSACVAVGMAV